MRVRGWEVTGQILDGFEDTAERICFGKERRLEAHPKVFSLSRWVRVGII